ncbi:MAG: hypothetical protein ACI4GC_07685 [Acutalibacteraceae bacterium]
MKKHIFDSKNLFSPDFFEEISSPLEPFEIKSLCHEDHLTFKGQKKSKNLKNKENERNLKKNEDFTD